MRSPLIAFSVFAAAVSPTLVSAAPQSPKLGNEGITHPRNTEVKFPQRFAFPRADPLSDPLGFLSGGAGGLSGGLPLGGTSTPPQSNAGYKPGQPLPGANSQQTAQPTDEPTDPAAAEDVDPILASNTPTDAAAAMNGRPREPKAPKAPDFVPRPPQPPNYQPKVPVPGGTGPRSSTSSGSDSGSNESNGP
ncbi:hypothetical protein C8Q77DRAFT_46980 [Trametes polyzona]|nr:hypothetical protein C8Q77DRAFT_46980 [Trametes polyzona]